MNNLIDIITNSIGDSTFIKCIFSNSRKAYEYSKVSLRPIVLKEELIYQTTSSTKTQEFHKNINAEAISNFIEENSSIFKQCQIFTSANDYHILINKKGNLSIKKSTPTLSLPTTLSHNRDKKYVLDNPASIPFLTELGIMDTSGKIKPSKYNKYKQINRYLEIVQDVIPELKNEKLKIIDFGCGKSYLTFALYHYLTAVLHKDVEVVGLDLKTDVIEFCNNLATKMGYDNLHFQVGDIGNYTTNKPIDMVVSLHACNTATDLAIAKAINWKSKIILAVPCCHHEAYTQIQNNELNTIFKHGILKERIAALVTDGLRSQLLESMGYKVNMLEFIDMEHTPKNILIRAISKPNTTIDSNAYKLYQDTAKMLSLSLTLDNLLHNELGSKINE